jgi:putative spermidine/putrescine transport system permease protein
LSLRWYDDFFNNRLWVNATWNSIRIALPVTAIATALGTLTALGLARGEFRGKSVVLAVLLAPIVTPIIIYAVAVFFFFAGIGIAGTFVSLVLAHVALALPFVIVTVLATLQGFDRTLIAAAAACGASPWKAFRHVMLPLILPGVLSGMILAFVTSFDEVVVVIFLSGPEMRTLPRQIWSGVREEVTPTISAAAVVLVVVSMVLMLLVELLRRRSERLRAGVPIKP